MDQTSPSILPIAPYGGDWASELDQDHKLLFDWWLKGVGFNCKSVPGRSIDLYSDCVARHSGETGPALTWFESDVLRSLSYAQISDESRDLAECWVGNGVASGHVVAILCTNPARRAIALLSGFRLGVTVSLLHFTGTDTLNDHLSLLNPDYIHCDSAFLGSIPKDLQGRLLHPTRRSSLDAVPSAAYSNHATALRLLNPFNESPQGTIEISAGYLFNRLLHDAYVILGLDRGATFAGMSAIENGVAPFPELACLLSGANFWFLDAEDWNSHADQLMSATIDLIAIPANARKALMVASDIATKKNWKRWIRNPIECLDYLSWKEFSTALALDGVPHADLLFTCQFSGISIGSVWKTDLIDMGLSVPRGASWHLGDLIDPTVPSSTSHGRLCSLVTNEQGSTVQPTPFLITLFGSSYRFIGCYPPGRQGQIYPSSRVIELLSGTDGRHVIIEKPGADGVESRTLYVLVCFQEVRTEESLLLLIQEKLGEFARPDEVYFSPLFPRLLISGQIDSDWVTRLFFRGEFQRRSEIPFYLSMARLKSLIYSELKAGRLS